MRTAIGFFGLVCALLWAGSRPACAQAGAKAAASVAASTSTAVAPDSRRLPAVRDDGSDVDEAAPSDDDDSGYDEAGNYGSGASDGVAKSTATATDAPKPPSDALLQACGNEIEFLCRDEQGDQDSLLDCLEDNEAGLTSGCRAVFDALRPPSGDQ